jgi:V/A-type H+-transporting ATPase subunit E
LDAKIENERIVKSGEDAIRQAGRNLLISFRESVTRELEAVLNENVNAVYSSEAFSKLIVSVIESWAKNPDAQDVTVMVGSEDLSALENTVLAAIKDKLLGGVTLKANDNFDGGFRIAVNNGSAYYDYSSEAVVEMLSNYLSPKLTELLKEAE